MPLGYQMGSQNVYGLREDGTVKGRGWLGPLKTMDGKTMTEKSIGVEIDGKETLIPLIVKVIPTMKLNSKS